MAAGKTTVLDVPEVVDRVLGEGTFSVEKFVESFGVLVEAAGGVKLLRELILTLAVRGQLTERQSTDDDVKNLVADIHRKRARLVVGRSGHGVDKGDCPVDDVPPFPIPTSWRWTRLEDLGAFMGGGTPSKSNLSFWKGPIPWVSPKDMKRPYVGDAEDHISQAAIEGSSTKLIPAKSILFVVRGMILAHSFPVAITTCEVTVNQDMKALVLACPVVADFMLRVCQDARRRVLERIERSSHGTCRLDSEVVESLLVPIPPLAEQKRIVARVDQLMALIDQLEAKQNRKREVGARFTKASLEALTTAESPQEFTTAWTRIQSAWSTLLDHPDKVSEIRRTVLELAVRGHLVPQSARDSSAVEMLVQIRKSKEVLFHAGKIRQGQAQGDAEPEAEFELPPGWQWTTVGDTFDVVGGIQKTPLRAPKEKHFPYLRVENVQRGRLDLGRMERFELDDEELKRWRLQREDLLVVEGNGSPTEIGRCALWNGEIEDCVHQNHIIRCRPIAPAWSRFAMVFLNSPTGTAEMRRLAITTSGLYSLSVGKIRGIGYPLPPLAEQRRIVAKVEHLMKLCDSLEATLRRSEDRAAKLVEAVVQEMVA